MSTHPHTNPKIPEGINSSQENPLREFAVLFLGVAGFIILATAVLAYSIGLLAPYIPFSWERKVAPLLESTAFLSIPAGSSGETRQLALQELGSELIASLSALPSIDSSIDGAITAADYHFHLIQNESPNAFATLGGHIFITDALLQQLSSENALAMVIAHEIAHIQYRHPVAAASRGILIQLALSAALGSSAGGLFGNALGSTGLYTALSFSREMESRADKQALRIMQSHYGHLRGADEFFQKMADQQGEQDTRWLEFARTHPNTGRRLRSIQTAIAESAESTSNRRPLTPLTERFGHTP